LEYRFYKHLGACGAYPVVILVNILNEYLKYLLKSMLVLLKVNLLCDLFNTLLSTVSHKLVRNLK